MCKLALVERWTLLLLLLDGLDRLPWTMLEQQQQRQSQQVQEKGEMFSSISGRDDPEVTSFPLVAVSYLS